MTSDVAELAKAQLKRRVRMWMIGTLVPVVLTGLTYAVAAFLALMLLLTPLLATLNVVTFTGHVAAKVLDNIGKGLGAGDCIFTGACDTSPGPSASSMDASAAELVMTQWLPQETAAVHYYCSRAGSRPCVNVAFVEAVMLQESGGNALADSSAGALGLMQVEPSHFSATQNPLDPTTNIMVGVGFLDQLDAEFGGNLPLVAAGYNAGPGAVQEWERMFGTVTWAALEREPVVQGWGDGQTYAYVNYVMAYFSRFSLPTMSPSGPAAGA
jgi:hypothetical protein